MTGRPAPAPSAALAAEHPDDARVLPLLARTCSAEWTRLWTVRTTWWFLGLGAVAVLGLGTLLGFESAADPEAIQGGSAWETASVIMMPAQLAFLGLVVVSVTADHATGGIVVSLQWTPRRTVLFTARTVVAVLLTSLTGTLLMAGAALAAGTTAGPALTLRPDDGLTAAGEVGLVLLTGSSLAAGLGFLLRSTAGALISLFLLVVVLPLLLPVFGDRMQHVADAMPGAGAIHLLIGPTGGTTTTSAVLVLLCWAGAALVLGWLRLVRTDAAR